MDQDNLIRSCRWAKQSNLTKKAWPLIEPITMYCSKFSATSVPDPYYGGESGFEDVLDLLEDAARVYLLPSDRKHSLTMLTIEWNLMPKSLIATSFGDAP